MTLPNADYALLLDYVDGTLSEEDRLAVEIRLSQESELAAELDSFETMDQLQREAKPRPQPKSLVPLPLPKLLLSLAAAAAVVLIFVTLNKPATLLVTRVAVLPTSPSILDHQRRELGLIGDAARTVPPGFGQRGHGDLIVLSDEELYLALIEPAQERWIAAGLAAGTSVAEAEFFVLPVEVSEPASVLVILIDKAGRVLDAMGEPGMAWPAESPWNASTARIQPGRPHVLPHTPVNRGEGELNYAGGFLVPLRAGRLTALVGYRKTPLDPDLEQSLRSAVTKLEGLEEGTVILSLENWLTSHDFKLQRMDIVEPVN